MSNILDSLTQFPLFCSYILVDTTSNKALIGHSSGNAISQIAEVITELRRGVFWQPGIQDAFNRQVLELKVLKIYESDLDFLILKFEAIHTMYNAGYTDITEKYTRRPHTVYTRVMDDYRNRFRHIPLVYVCIKSRNVGAIVIGVFNDMLEADAFIQQHYAGQPDNPELVFASNELTKGYHSIVGYRPVEWREKK